MNEFRKPNRKDLTSYVYPPSVGIGGKIIPVERTLHIGEKGVTAEDIKRLYSMDAQEAHNNISPEQWKAFCRRITAIKEFKDDGSVVEHEVPK